MSLSNPTLSPSTWYHCPGDMSVFLRPSHGHSGHFLGGSLTFRKIMATERCLMGGHCLPLMLAIAFPLPHSSPPMYLVYLPASLAAFTAGQLFLFQTESHLKKHEKLKRKSIEKWISIRGLKKAICLSLRQNCSGLTWLMTSVARSPRTSSPTTATAAWPTCDLGSTQLSDFSMLRP